MTEPSLEQELQELTGALREHLLWQKACGTTVLPLAERTMAAELPTAEPSAPVVSPPRRAPLSAPGPAMPERRAAVVEPAAAVPVLSTPSRVPQFEIPADPQARVARLQQLAVETASCTKCVLHTGRKQAVFARGTPATELVFVGEGPGAEEDAQGEPFVGKAGQLLDRMIQAMGMDREQVYICNIVKCRPPQNRAPEPEEMAACIPYLHEQLALIQPKAIVALGGTAAKGLLGVSEGITRLRGKWRLYRASIPVMPTFHPAYLLRKEDAKREVWADLKLVLQQLGRPIPERGAK
jgi:DNA polymerase